MSTTRRPAPAQLDGNVIAKRPVAGTPRPYDFPTVAEHRLDNGLRILVADLPGRPLVSASLVLSTGAADEPAAEAGATVLAARALSEGTEHYDAIALIEASERLGASLHADAGWDAFSAGVDVPADRLPEALGLLAELVLHPTFPAAEVERLREERLNDILQAKADPRRRAEETFIGTIYAPSSPYHRPSGGTQETVEGLTPAVLRRAWAAGLDPARATLVVGGDLGGQDVASMVAQLFDDWGHGPGVAAMSSIDDAPSSAGRLVRVVHRPGSVQTEIRIGHRGLRRRIPDFHAVSVMSAILGGLFNSRLNMKLREEKGYTYGAGAGFDLRRGAGPFAARAAVNTEVTVPAILDTLTELTRMRDTAVTKSELAAARDFLIGVFPLRFETASAVVGALSGLVVHGLPVEELVGYRSRIEAVGIDDIAAAAAGHLDVEHAAIVLVGDVDAFGPALEAEGLGRIVIEPDDVVGAPGPAVAVAAVLDEADAADEEAPVALDEEPTSGPTAGAEEPSLPGAVEVASADTAPGEAD
jgi:predicted Zn-dependent peptidase